MITNVYLLEQLLSFRRLYTPAQVAQERTSLTVIDM